MHAPATLAAGGLIAGAVSGLTVASDAALLSALLCVAATSGWFVWWRRSDRLTCAAIVIGFACAGGALSTVARADALHTPLRALLDHEFGGFAIDSPGPGGQHDPLLVSAVLRQDAAAGSDVTMLQATIESVRLGGREIASLGHAMLTVGGRVDPARAAEWRAGRRIAAFVTFRRPAKYLNDGGPDLERDLALAGTTLFGSIKSAMLVEVRARGSVAEEIAAAVRAHVRRHIGRHVAVHDPLSSAIVTAVLIGDRTGLPDEVRLRLQAAGTYHVIAISGGNIAILAGLLIGLLRACGVAGRGAAALAILLLAGYAAVVTTGPSVWRATLMAILYLAAQLFDHRSTPWHALAAAAALIVSLRPLDVRDAGFLLTFGATIALLEAGRRAMGTRGSPVRRWLVASVAASLAAEIALMPVSAWTFSRVTSAGLVLNLAAVPLMGVVQVGGLAVACLGAAEPVARAAGWLAHLAAAALVESARLVDVAPWLVARVPAPPLALIAGYYAMLALALTAHGRRRVAGLAGLALAAAAIITGQPAGWIDRARQSDALSLTVFDVGQGDAALLRFPDRSQLLVDAGGIPFGSRTFDVGARVLAPALWARGIRRLDAVVVTHGDPDHAGGLAAILEDFAPGRVWEGVPAPAGAPLDHVLQRGRVRGADMGALVAGDRLAFGGAIVRVLHPPIPDWERLRVRNDDSVVLEVRYGDVAVLLPGDIGAAVERTLLPHLAPARHRILKVAHHGSRTSTSRELLEHWRPQIALISSGRGNTFGHPAPEVLRRLDAIGAAIYRTDVHGQITVATDGTMVAVRTHHQKGRQARGYRQ